MTDPVTDIDAPDGVIPEDQKRAYVVMSPPSSGNRYVVQLLIDAGCFGNSGHEQPVDAGDITYRVTLENFDAEDMPQFIAFHRSFPHGRDKMFPDPIEIKETLEAGGYTVVFVCITRDPNIVVRSSVRAGHFADIASAVANLKYWGECFDKIAATGCDFFNLDYQRFKDDDFRSWLKDKLGLPGEMTTPFVDGDNKYGR